MNDDKKALKSIRRVGRRIGKRLARERDKALVKTLLKSEPPPKRPGVLEIHVFQFPDWCRTCGAFGMGCGETCRPPSGWRPKTKHGRKRT